MPVTVPNSASPIASGSVTGMHATVRSVINAVSASNILPGTFGVQHVPGILIASDVLEVTAGVTLNTEPVPFTDADPANIATWQDLNTYRLSNSGAGYALTNCTVMAFVSLRLSEMAATSSNEMDQYWFNLHVRINGVDFYDIINSRCVYIDVPTVMTGAISQSNYIEKTVNIIAIFEYKSTASFTLTHLGVKAAKASSGGAAVPNVTIANGLIGFLAFYPDA